MSADTLKSTSITNLDSSPVVQNTSGQGGKAPLWNSNDYVSATALGLGNTGSTYKMVRVPSCAILKDGNLIATTQLDSNATPALAIDLGAYYSDSNTDGTEPANVGTSISVNCFVAAVAFGSSAAGTKLDCLSAFSVDKRVEPLWKALALSSDPGGFIDIVLAVHTAANTGVAGKIALNLNWTM